MSEPMSSVEIEDVLSSIRRLVSDDLRPQARALREARPAVAADQPDVRPVSPPADKLMLTPALRIVLDAGPAAQPAPDALAAEQSAPEQSALDADASDAEFLFHTVRGGADEAPFVEAEEESVAGIAPQPLRVAPVVPLADADAYDDDGAAAPEDFTTAIPPEFFDVADPVEAVAPVSESWADEFEASVRAELEAEATQTAYARFIEEPEADALDETAMRDLVRDIIREELQGTLGERITRNVRKLVRTEIARALAVRDFD